MTTNTYVALDKVTVGTATPSITFSSIPQTYTDLVIVSNSTPTTSGGVDLYLTVNGDTTSGLYSKTHIAGYGSSAGSTRFSGDNRIPTFWQVGPDNTQPFTVNYSINNYTNTSVFKTVLARAGAFQSSASEVNAFIGLWRNTNAITSVTLTVSSGNFAVGSTFELYGILAEGVSPTTKATGGAVYSDDVYYYHVFGASGTFTPTQSITAQVLVVGTGGVGGVFSGGGGAGGSIGYSSSASLASGTAYTATIGASGTVPKVNSSGSKVQNATASTNCTFSGSGISTITGTAGGNGTDNGAGGSNLSFSGGSGSGGGGAGFGANGSAGAGGAGGTGVSTYSSWGQATGLGQKINGTYWFAGGGGGSTGSGSSAGAGGNGGGGAGGADGFSGTAYTGGGGGGAKNSPNYGDGGAGGTGVVIVRYAK
jgi:hypothetical protein